MVDSKRILELSAPTMAKFCSDVAVVLDKTGNIIFVNDRVETWLGYKVHELTGANIAVAGIVSQNSIKVVLQNLVLRFLGREIQPYSIDFVAKDKRILTGTIKGQLIRDETGNILGDLIMITDISEKETYKKALDLERKKTDIYIDVVGMIVVILDKEGKITLLNKKGCEILKTTKEEAIGENWFDTFVPEKDRAKTKEEFSEIISGNLSSAEDFENRIIATNGEEKLISWHNTYLRDEKGNIYATLSSGDDVTQRSEAEKRLADKTEELEKVNQLMIGRELRMVELKKQIATLEEKIK